MIVIFSLLFIIERKPMNIIFNFIGIIISVAFLLGYHHSDYISYLLIIIYCSALSIIFAFVIMLTPTPSYPNFPFFLFPFLLLLSFFVFSSHSDFIVTTTSLPILSIDNDLLIEKIGEVLYLDPINIFKFLIASLILLLALIALFFILLPTL